MFIYIYMNKKKPYPCNNDPYDKSDSILIFLKIADHKSNEVIAYSLEISLSNALVYAYYQMERNWLCCNKHIQITENKRSVCHADSIWLQLTRIVRQKALNSITTRSFLYLYIYLSWHSNEYVQFCVGLEGLHKSYRVKPMDLVASDIHD